MISRFYYSLTAEQKEVVSLYALNEFGMRMSDSGIIHTFNRYFPIAKEYGINWLIGQLTSTGTGEEDTDITKKLLEHIWLNLYDKNVGYVDVVHPRWENPSKPFSGEAYINMRQELGNSIWSIYIDTKERYETLINMYNSELEGLLDGVRTVTDGDGTVRFNDTPQNTPTAGGYAEDNYSTNVTTNKNTVTVTSDINTKMARIDEIYRLLKNLYADWAFEFNKLIVGE